MTLSVFFTSAAGRCGTNPCHESSTCLETSASYVCLCEDGLFYDGSTCTSKHVLVAYMQCASDDVTDTQYLKA